MKKILLICSFFLIAMAIKAQEKGVLTGKVLDENNLPLPGASVIIEKINIGTSTDFDGNYTLVSIPNGKYTVKVMFLGYQDKNIEIAINGNTLAKNIKLDVLTNKLNEVVVRGSLAKGQAKALNKQKTNANITNVISSDQVGKFPDANIGDALKRVPGISMQNDQGEARDIIIRGLAPQLNAVTLNGDRIPSAEGDNRRVQMDLIPSDMIQTIEVSKAVTSDMEADAIGGSVNLVTRSAPSTFRASVTGAYGMNPVRDGANYSFSGLVANRTKNDKFGYVINASFNSNDYGSDNVEFEWKKDNFIKEHDIRRYDVKRIRKSIGANLDWKIAPKHKIAFKSIFTQRNDLENRYRVRYKYKEKKGKEYFYITRQTKGGIDNNDNHNRRLERQQTYKFGVDGDHIIFDNVKLDWKVSVSKASEKRPNERYATYVYKAKASEVMQNALNTKKPYFSMEGNADNAIENFKIDEITEEFKDTKEEKVSSRINLEIPLTTKGEYQNSFKLGYKYKYKEKSRDNNYVDYTKNFEDKYEKFSSVPTSDKTVKGFLPGEQYKSGFFATKEFLGSLKLTGGEAILEEFIPYNYEANENIYAFYGMLKQKLGKQFSVIIGLRTEKTAVDYSGYAIDVETAEDLADVTKTQGKQSYTNWLPNIHLKYKPAKNTVLRAAWTHTIARPNYYDLVPYKNINSDDEEASFGNPNLKAAQSSNLDIMAEHYFANVGIISLGGFYKNIDDFIYEKTTTENLTVGGNESAEYQVTRPLNGATAKVYGFEFALQRKLNFLPGFLRNLNLYLNYTYTDSEAKGIAGRKDGLALTGAVKNMFNGSLAYETDKLSIRTSLNYADDYIDEYGDDAFYDRYYDSQLFLDINTSYEIVKNLRLFTEFKNLTNQELRYYQGTKNHTMQAEYYDFNWNVGLKYNF